MRLIRSHGVLYIQVVLSLIFSYSGWEFIPLVPALRFRGLRDVGKAVTSENLMKKSC